MSNQNVVRLAVTAPSARVPRVRLETPDARRRRCQAAGGEWAAAQDDESLQRLADVRDRFSRIQTFFPMDWTIEAGLTAKTLCEVLMGLAEIQLRPRRRGPAWPKVVRLTKGSGAAQKRFRESLQPYFEWPQDYQAFLDDDPDAVQGFAQGVMREYDRSRATQ